MSSVSIATTVLCQQGHFDSAIRLAKEMVDIFEEKGDRRCATVALLDVVDVYLARGEFREARRAALEVRAAFHEFGDWEGEVAVLKRIMASHFKAQNPDEGVQTAEEI